jgi:DUF1009 family protein
MTNSSHKRIGLVAGWGNFPRVVAETLVENGYELYTLGILDHADESLADLSVEYQTVGLAQLGRAIRFFRKRDVRLATMAGKIHKVLLFRKFSWMRHLPDWRCIRTFYPHFVTRRKDKTDDTLLLTVIAAYAEDGIRFAPATDFAPELLVNAGILTARKPSASQWKDIEFGWSLAKEMGRLDIGQSVAVRGQAVLAVEAIEGTDLCIARAGELCEVGGFTLVKVAKPQQDMRFDVPTIGVGTLESLRKAGGQVLAIEADKTIVIDEPAVIAYAKKYKLSIVAIESADEAAVQAAA